MITTLDIGGAERIMVDLLPLLQKDGNVVDLLLFNGAETSFKREIISKGVRVFHLSCCKGLKGHIEVYNPVFILKLKKYLKGYDIIHTHNTACQLYVPVAAMLSKSTAKLITTEHNTFNRRRSKRWLKPIDKWMYSRYSAIACISDQTKNHLINYIGNQDKLFTIYNGVKISRFIKPVSDISKKNCFLISMVAAFRKQKDHETLIRAMAQLPANYCLNLIGRDFDEIVPALKLLCIDLGIEDRVSFLGARSDVPELFEKSDIAVLSSHWEGFGLAAVEAMASGRPLIASDVDGLRDVVNGAGVLFPQGDSKALAQKIQWLCEHPYEYQEVARRCQERAKQYDISLTAEKYLQLYSGLYD